jgi:hypothetical protein
LRQTLASAEKRDDGSVLLNLDATIELEGRQRPAAVAENLRLLFPQPA